MRLDQSRVREEDTVLKVCARFRAGVQFGLGFVLERACGEECTTCTGGALDRQCRKFTFKPHYEVKMEKKESVPKIKVRRDFLAASSTY
jgi:hypothetical protein